MSTPPLPFASAEDAKAAASRLQRHFEAKGNPLGRGQSLEAIAAVCGFGDWNTLNARLAAQPPAGTSSPCDVAQIEGAKIARYLGLFPGGERQCVDMLWNMQSHTPGVHADRALFILRLVVDMHHLVYQKIRTDQPMTAETLYNACDPRHPLRGGDTGAGFYDLLHDLIHRGEACGISARKVRIITDGFSTMHGWDLDRARHKKEQTSAGQDNLNWNLMQISKPLNALIEA